MKSIKELREDKITKKDIKMHIAVHKKIDDLADKEADKMDESHLGFAYDHMRYLHKHEAARDKARSKGNTKLSKHHDHAAALHLIAGKAHMHAKELEDQGVNATKEKTHASKSSDEAHLMSRRLFNEHMLHSYTLAPDVERINGVFDQVTAKYYGNQHVFIEAVRAVLNFWGIQLPTLPAEQQIHGPNAGHAMSDLHFGPGHDDNRNIDGVHENFEYAFKIECMSVQGAESAPELYLYMCSDRADVDGDAEHDMAGGEVWECYAQVVGPEDLADLMDDGPPARDFSHPTGDIMSGETDYQKQIRHVGVVSSGDPEETK